MVTPPALKSGDQVAIVATARKVPAPSDLDLAINLLKSWGLQPVLGKTLSLADDQYAGTDAERLADLQAMLDNPEIRAIWCAKGGYGTVRIVDGLDFYKFIKAPKWIVGFSDVTVLHSHLHKIGFKTLHATMPLSLEDNSAFAKASLKQALFGEALKYTIDGAPLNRAGTGQGQLVGGNISILYSLCGSPSAIDTREKILFLEDLDEYLYHVDRMMLNLKRNGMLNQLKGLIVGGLTKMHDNSVPFGKTAAEIIAEAASGCDYPVCFDFPAGHIDDNRALILGAEVQLTVDPQGTQLNFR
ncbi:LD-carboxypeptidase [Flavobacteriaceae bacterium YJPT1-3]|nr:LD-carboxypeptidase [Flavobacteriaceae bacterium YJPT1-3]